MSEEPRSDNPPSDDPTKFYTGLVAEAYSALVSMPSDPAPYARFVRAAGGTALELACGDGTPMLDLIADGLKVEGLDSSVDMLDRCRARAKAKGLEVTLHQDDMANFDLGRLFGSIFIAGPSITLLPDDATVGQCLSSVMSHCQPGAPVMIPFWIPAPPGETPPPPRSAASPEPDGGELRLTTVSVDYDAAACNQTSVLRYERLRQGEVVESVERPWEIHWLAPETVVDLAAAAGFTDITTLDLNDSPATADSMLFTLRATAPS